MLLTATTLKDSLANVRFFVEANLAAGVDHLLVFLDDPAGEGQQEVGAWLDEHPRTTCLRTDRSWWRGERPRSLNVRQRTNVGWALAVLEPLPWAEWLFHVDGDEVALVDREALAAVPVDRDAVWLPPWEAVSEWDSPGRPTRFKRLLDDDELTLLHVLGGVAEPSNQHHFHGHVMGKSGVRPSSGLGLTLHDAVGPDGRKAPRHDDERLRVLHYDAPSGQEFVRKWEALASAGPARYRKSRQATARAIRTLVTRDLPEETRRRYLRRLYELTTADDVALLGDLGMLVDVDPLAAPAPLRDLPPGAREELAERVARLSGEPKAPYFVDDPAPAGEGPRDQTRDRSRDQRDEEPPARAALRRLLPRR